MIKGIFDESTLPDSQSWRTLSEWQQEHDDSLREVERKYLAGELDLALHTPRERFLAYVEAYEPTRTGIAHFTYRGPIKIEHRLLEELLDKSQVRLGTDRCAILDVQQIQDWSTSCPFQGFPVGRFSGWADWEEDYEDWHPVYQCLFPPLRMGLGSTMERITNSNPIYEETESGRIFKDLAATLPKGWAFDESTAGIFKIDDLCISAKQTPVPPRDLDVLAQRPPLMRTDAMSELLWRVLVDHPKISAKDCLRLLQIELDADSPKYDLDLILLRADALAVEWRDSKGLEKTVTLKVLANRLSRLRSKSPGRQDIAKRGEPRE